MAIKELTIIITAYNAEAWLARCVSSVSSAADNAEIIVVDDGSDDETGVIADTFKPDGVKVIHSSHGGAGKARSVGVMAATAPWVMFVDADDTLTTSGVASLMCHASDAVDIVVGGVRVFDDDKTSREFLHGDAGRINAEDYVVDILEGREPGMLHGKMFRRRLFDSITWDTHPAITNHEDAMLLIQLVATTSHNIATTDIVVYNYIRRDNSLSAMRNLTLEGVARVWDNVSALDLPRVSLVKWGLGLLYLSLIVRGIPFDNNYPPAVTLRRLSRHEKLGRVYHPAAIMLRYPFLRRVVAWRHRSR